MTKEKTPEKAQAEPRYRFTVTVERLDNPDLKGSKIKSIFQHTHATMQDTTWENFAEAFDQFF